MSSFEPNLSVDQNFSLIDLAGQQFSAPEIGFASGDAASQFNLDTTLATQPMIATHLGFVFDVAPGMSGFTLVNAPLFSNTSKTIFHLRG